MTRESPAENPSIPDLRLEGRDGLAILTFDRPESRVNLLTREVMERLDAILTDLEEASARGDARALLLRSAKPDNFIAGADIDDLARLEDAESARRISRAGQSVFDRLDRLSIPTLAAIHGTCVGGGLELALTCDYRVASRHPRTRLGLPEVRLGILPGLGGTVRLPRLVGLRAALDLILTGKQIDPVRARGIGLVDRLIEPDGFGAEVERLGAALAGGERPLPRSGRSVWQRWVEDGPLGRRVIAVLARRSVLSETRGNYPAPLKALDVTVHNLSLRRDRALDFEARAFGELAAGPVCKNLIAVFRLTERARKRQPAGTARDVRRAAVIGAGVMGSGIAELFAYQGIRVQVVDLDDERVHAGIERAEDLLKRLADRRNWSPDELRRRSECLVGSTDYEGFGDVDLVIEAVVERMDVKRQVFEEIERRLPEGAVIATNTSALSITELQGSLSDPGRACGLHFFNPPHRMPLVEVVRGRRSSEDALATAFRTAIRLGKTPVIVDDSPGFVVNRILAAYLTEAGHLLQEGMTIPGVDRIMRRFGMPMGPCRLLDEVGLDVVAEVGVTLREGLGPRFEPAPAVARVVETGRTGKKGGRGFYRYRDGRARGVDDEVEDLLRREAAGSPPDHGTAEQRMVFIMVNEAARTLDDAVVTDPADIDLAMILGTGFPPFRGGLLRHADHLGLERIASRLRELEAELGPRFAPAPGLTERRAFYDG